MIRDFTAGDARALAALCRVSIRELGIRKYSPEQVQAWLDRAPAAEMYLTWAARGARIFVAEARPDVIAAYALLEPDGHLDRLFCHPVHAGRGHASALLAHAEQVANGLNLARLFSEVSEVARPVFERAGYSVEHRRDFEMKGVPIHNYAMAKNIRGGVR